MTPGRDGDAMMAATHLEEAAPPVEQTVVTSPLAGEGGPARKASPVGWGLGMYVSRERRLWPAALAAALLVAGGALALLYVDDTNFQNADRALTIQNESLTGRNQLLMDQLKFTQTNLSATLGELAQTKAELQHPHLVIWNVAQTISGHDVYLAGGVPDTFTYHLEATSSGAMSVSILTFEEFAKAVECVDYGKGVTDYCMHHNGAVHSWLGQTSVNFDFHEAEGCADYVVVFTAASSVTVTPNVSVTYNPANAATGACA